MVDKIVLKDIPCEITAEDIAAFFGKRAGKMKFDDYIPSANRIAKPKAIIAWADCEVLDDTHVRIETEVFDSVLLADKLKGLHRVLLYVVTAGNELKDTTEIQQEAIKDMLSAVALMSGMKAMYQEIDSKMGLNNLSALNPGSLPDWPIANNHKLCRIIGNVDEIGVSLNESGYMIPWNSSSGILFSGDGYQNCSLCTKLDCIGRRAEFNKEEYSRLFKK